MSRHFLAQFIELYESEPCLWQVSSIDYHNKIKREAAYAKLLDKFKDVDNTATKYDVIKKINNIRSALRKENKKIRDSLKSGASADTVYKPKLWYFSMLSFLSDQDIPRDSCSNLDSDDDGVVEGTFEADVPNIQVVVELDESIENSSGTSTQAVPSTCTSAPPTPRRQSHKRGDKKDSMEGMAKEVLVTVKDYFKKPRTEEDRFDIIGKGFAMKLRGLPKEQMLLAEKLINETLFQAEMGCLTMSHRVVGEPQPHYSPRYHPPVSYQGSPAGSHTSLTSHSSATTENLQAHVLPNQDFLANLPYGIVSRGNEVPSSLVSYVSSFDGRE